MYQPCPHPVPNKMHYLGAAIAVVGSTVSISGALANGLFLMHTLAMDLWLISNPLFVIYFVGVDLKRWNGNHIGTRAMIITYLVFTVSNFYGRVMGG